MRSFFLAESCKETHPNALNPQSWLQIERGKLPKLSSYPSSASIESLVKVPQPVVRPFYKPADHVEVLAQIHKELESCPPQERSNLFLLQYQVFRGLGEVKLMRRSLQGAWQKANTVHEKIIFGAWLKYEKQEEELIADLLANCGKCAKEFAPVDIASHLPFDVNVSSVGRMTNENYISQNVTFTIGDEEIVCDRQKIYELSAVLMERDRGGGAVQRKPRSSPLSGEGGRTRMAT